MLVLSSLSDQTRRGLPHSPQTRLRADACEATVAGDAVGQCPIEPPLKFAKGRNVPPQGGASRFTTARAQRHQTGLRERRESCGGQDQPLSQSHDRTVAHRIVLEQALIQSSDRLRGHPLRGQRTLQPFQGSLGESGMGSTSTPFREGAAFWPRLPKNNVLGSTVAACSCLIPHPAFILSKPTACSTRDATLVDPTFHGVASGSLPAEQRELLYFDLPPAMVVTRSRFTRELRSPGYVDHSYFSALPDRIVLRRAF